MKLHFDLGQDIFVERNVGKAQIKATSTILGAREPNYLIIDMPQHESKTMFLRAAEDCIVRFFSDGRMVGFRALIVKAILEPVPMAVLRYPEEYEQKTLRRHDRVDCNIPTTLTLDDAAAAAKTAAGLLKNDKGAGLSGSEAGGLAPMSATIINLSQGGLQILLPIYDEGNPRGAAGLVALGVAVAQHPLYRLDVLEALYAQEIRLHMGFDIPPPVETRFNEIACEVRWTIRQKENFFLGVRFVDPPEEATRSIGAIIEHQFKHFFAPVKPV
ncbi:flagellar brake protein [Candidatus Sumerlaeota bacterium]|nr:flagellar brake protein [Candidatus Sumerlaeota bacterium]